MKRTMTAEVFVRKLNKVLQELRKLPVDSREEVYKKLLATNQEEFLNDQHLLDWLQGEAEWHQAFEA